MLIPAIRSFQVLCGSDPEVRIDEVDGTFDVAAAAQFGGNDRQHRAGRTQPAGAILHAGMNNLIKRYRLHDLAHDLPTRLQSAEREPAERCYEPISGLTSVTPPVILSIYQEPLADAVNRHNAEATALL